MRLPVSLCAFCITVRVLYHRAPSTVAVCIAWYMLCRPVYPVSPSVSGMHSVFRHGLYHEPQGVALEPPIDVVVESGTKVLACFDQLLVAAKQSRQPCLVQSRTVLLGLWQRRMIMAGSCVSH